MQITKSVALLNEFTIASRARIDGIKVFKNVLSNYKIDFVASLLDHKVKPTPRFNMKGFFLESSVDTSIKSVPVFIFSLERREAQETYISCFYGELFPGLFDELSKKNLVFDDHAFFFNWFDHEFMIPMQPTYQDEITNVFYMIEREYLGYRFFDSTSCVTEWSRRQLHLHYFRPGAFPYKKKTTRRGDRFYKRKFDWFLKQYA